MLGALQRNSKEVADRYKDLRAELDQANSRIEELTTENQVLHKKLHDALLQLQETKDTKDNYKDTLDAIVARALSATEGSNGRPN